MRERSGLLARAKDLEWSLAGEDLRDEIGHRVRDARLVVGKLAGSIGVERPADRVRQAVLRVGGAAVDLAGQLGEAVRRARHRALRQVVLGRGEELGTLEDHR